MTNVATINGAQIAGREAAMDIADPMKTWRLGSTRCFGRGSA